MTPQFVDLNADGHVDMVAGTFRGSPYVAYGTETGFKPPVDLLDENGKFITINQFWNYEAKKWDTDTSGDPVGAHKLENGHLTSTWAFDWDNDGDLDLLLGCYRTGHIYRRMNNGSKTEPKFGATNFPLMAGGKPLKVTGKCSTPKMVDFDGDGLMDLVAGGMGDTWGRGDGAGIYLWRNVGFVGAPEFASPVALVEPEALGNRSGPERPEAGLYMDVVDYDGDGDLDLVVGGYSLWNPPTRELTDEEKARVEVIKAEISELTKQSMEYSKAVAAATKGMDAEAAAAKRAEMLAEWRPKLNEISAKRAPLQAELNALVPTQQRRSFVWLYENVKPAKKAGSKPAPKSDTASVS